MVRTDLPQMAGFGNEPLSQLAWGPVRSSSFVEGIVSAISSEISHHPPVYASCRELRSASATKIRQKNVSMIEVLEG